MCALIPEEELDPVWSAQKHISGIYFNKVAQISHINCSEIAMHHTANPHPPTQTTHLNLKTSLEEITCDKNEWFVCLSLIPDAFIASFNYLPSSVFSMQIHTTFQQRTQTSAKNITNSDLLRINLLQELYLLGRLLFYSSLPLLFILAAFLYFNLQNIICINKVR